MDKLIDFNSPSGLLVSICIILTASLVFKVGEFLWKLREKKDTASEQAIENLTKELSRNTLAMEHLDSRIEKLEAFLSEMPKFKLDMRRLYSAIKMLSGDKWAEIRKEIMEEDNTI